MDERVLLAYAIASYDSALRSMTALRDAGEVVGYGTTGAIRRSLIQFAARWESLVNGALLWHDDNLDRVVEEARRYCTTHQPEIDELANREREDP